MGPITKEQLERLVEGGHLVRVGDRHGSERVVGVVGATESDDGRRPDEAGRGLWGEPEAAVAQVSGEVDEVLGEDCRVRPRQAPVATSDPTPASRTRAMSSWYFSTTPSV